MGASGNAGKAGYAMVSSLANFPGPVYAINPRAAAVGESILNLETKASVAELKGQVDLAVLTVPAQMVPEALEQCGEAGVTAAVICAGGFSESGDEGSALQQQAVHVATTHGIRLLGPNTSGFMNPRLGLFANFMPSVTTLSPGPVAVVAQSGGVNLALAFMLDHAGIGTSLSVGLGNGADVGFVEVLDHLANDPETTAVALHVEGVADGAALMDAVLRVSTRKPVIAIKVGKNDVGDFAKSHTGALTGSYEVTRAALSQAGAVVVDSLAELVDAVTALSTIRLQPHPGPGAAVITGQAGPGLILADALAEAGVPMPALHSETTAQLQQLLPALTYQRNPVDTGRPGGSFPAVARAVSEDPSIALTAVYALDEPGAFDPVAALGPLSGHVMFASGGPKNVLIQQRERLRELRIPMFHSPDALAHGVAAVVKDAQLQFAASQWPVRPAFGRGAILGSTLDESEGKRLIAEAGVQIPAGRTAANRQEAHAALEDLGGPLVVKVLDAAILHKADVGGVHTNIRTPDQLDVALDVIDRIPNRSSGRYLLERQAGYGVELIVGGVRDAAFGPVVALSLGGTDVEISNVSPQLRVAPLSRPAAIDMVLGLPPALLAGHRGSPPIDPEAVADILLAVSELLMTYSDITEVDLNPVRITAEGSIVLDALIICELQH
ncbi:CoA-binding domain-containing protein [Paeniglutamicibacter gangotriensis Lz1y]|uniref:CoA-binding domain-containing protein n=2 Tax=Paeniglutamicibacter gangotriensis TaxID=254787 RepID=M7MK84_9MICC|nr:CoA-binding domain-containing protein [Paeniglutamicibacter gangotriensis Lz1y]